MSSWIQVNINSGPVLAEIIAEFITTLSNRGVEIDDTDPDKWQITGFLDNLAQQAKLEEYLQGISEPWEMSTSLLPDQDWHENWRQNFAPFQLSPRIWISPPWEVAPVDDISIIIDPGQAFGTGQHESTRLCLLTLETMQLPATALDIGCGTGILAIAFLKLGGRHALGIDIDPLALEASAHNAALNGLSSLELSDSPLKDISRTFPLVMANLTAMDLREMAADISPRVKASGRLLCAGLLQSQARDVLLAFPGFSLEQRQDLNGWSSLLMLKTGE